MRVVAALLKDRRGAGALEFALVAPAFIVLIVGIAQLGLVFFASAGLSNAVAEGSRRATLFPRPTAEDVRDSIEASQFGLNDDDLGTPSVTYDTTVTPSFADVEMTYTMTLNFIVFQKDIELKESRRVYLQPLPQNLPTTT